MSIRQFQLRRSSTGCNSKRMFICASLLVIAVQSTGCATAPKPTGFLSDYSNLQDAEAGAMRYISPNLKHYTKFMVAPIQMNIERDAVTHKQRLEIAAYMLKGTKSVLKAQGYPLVSQAGDDVAEVRIAITDVQKAKWYLNVSPASKVTGAGTGGASMESEIIDSVTGEQLAAVIQVGRGNQFELDTFDELDDVKDVIDKWCKAAGERLDEMRWGKKR